MENAIKKTFLIVKTIKIKEVNNLKQMENAIKKMALTARGTQRRGVCNFTTVIKSF